VDMASCSPKMSAQVGQQHPRQRLIRPDLGSAEGNRRSASSGGPRTADQVGDGEQWLPQILGSVIHVGRHHRARRL